MQIIIKANLSTLAMISNYFKKDFQKVEPNQQNLIIKTIKTAIIRNLPSWPWQTKFEEPIEHNKKIM